MAEIHNKDKPVAETGQVQVTYKTVDGAHFFLSSDKDAAGLCVANADLKTAFEDVSAQLSNLFEFNHGVKVMFSPSVPFDEFKKIVNAAESAVEEAHQGGVIIPSMIQPWIIPSKSLAA